MNFKKLLLLSLALSACFAGIVKPIEERWNWSKKNPKLEQTINNYISKDFLFGTGTSDIQINGTFTKDGRSVENTWTSEYWRPQPGKAADHWHHLKEDIGLIYDAGMRVYRFSIDWSKIEQHEGEWDQQVVDDYKEIIRECHSKGIKPIVCFFHHAWPKWFGAKGAFEKSENSKYFKRYVHRMIDELHSVGAKSFVPYNETAAIVMSQYVVGKLWPSKWMRLWQGGIVLKNMLRTDVELSLECKEKYPDREWGTIHVMHPLHPYSGTNIEKFVCDYFGYLTNQVVLDYYTTGKFRWLAVGTGGYSTDVVVDDNPDAPKSIDYIGINYYTHTLIKQKYGIPTQAKNRPDETVSDDKAIYPEGLYWAIQQADQVKKPIMIMENGISDSQNKYREEHNKKHMYVIAKAIKNGYPVIGYFNWTFMDSFNWSTGYTKPYGIYSVDYKDGSLKREMRPSAHWFVNLMRDRADMSPISESKTA